MTKGNSQKLRTAGWDNGLGRQINTLTPAEIKIVEGAVN